MYKSGERDCARIVYYEEQIDETTRIIVYKDVDENNSKRKSYKQLIDLGENNYTQENYAKYCEWWGVYFIMLIADLIRSRLNESVKKLKISNISTFDILVKAGHMRMVQDGTEWRLRNTRTKDPDMLAAMGFTPQKTYPSADKGS
ncbi:MAG: hypothetical protein LIO80_00370 [Lachnospiraceae bacterium]|nr:hypothetical protein [Lachnospiraceae bacterium]